jgi:hypothetical protein
MTGSLIDVGAKLFPVFLERRAALIGARFQAFAGAEDGIVQFRFEYGALGQRRQVLGDANQAFIKLQEFDLLLVLLGAENQSDGGVFGFRAPLLLIQPAEIEFHLAFIRGFETAEFQFDRDEAGETTAVEPGRGNNPGRRWSCASAERENRSLCRFPAGTARYRAGLPFAGRFR